ncbi:putative leucine-rich repeat domain superfamily [Helianthus annuus]|nr:putative leucine-rich repeat domain superfamily [Helianthus annuus]
MKKLKFLDLSNSKELWRLDLGLTPKLERLHLEDCDNLVRLKVPGGCLKSLVYLNLNGCESLKSISFIEQLESLEFLHMCRLNLGGNEDIEKVPSLIGNLRNLVSLNLESCRKLKSVPGSICSLQHLRTLDLKNTAIEELPEDLGQLECLEYLDLGFTKVKHLPGSICVLKHLKTLSLFDCELLEKLPEDIGQLQSLEELDLRYCPKLKEIPNNICELKCLKTLLNSSYLREKLWDIYASAIV